MSDSESSEEIYKELRAGRVTKKEVKTRKYIRNIKGKSLEDTFEQLAVEKTDKIDNNEILDIDREAIENLEETELQKLRLEKIELEQKKEEFNRLVQEKKIQEELELHLEKERLALKEKEEQEQKEIQKLVFEQEIKIKQMAEFEYSDFSHKIPEFAGEKDMLKVFIQRCDAVHDSLKAAGQELFYKNLVFKLKGKPFTIFSKVESWAEFKKELLQDGQQTIPIHSILAKMNDLRQGNKSVREFAEEINKVLEDLEFSINLNYAEDIVRKGFKIEHKKAAIRIFKEGLYEPLKGRVFACSSGKTLEETIQIALEEELFLKRDNYNRGNYPNRMNYNRKWNNSPIKKEVEKRNPKENNNKLGLKCYRCNKLGHIAKDCYVRLPSTSNVKREVNLNKLTNSEKSLNVINNKKKIKHKNASFSRENLFEEGKPKNFFVDRSESHAAAINPLLSE